PDQAGARKEFCRGGNPLLADCQRDSASVPSREHPCVYRYFLLRCTLGPCNRRGSPRLRCLEFEEVEFPSLDPFRDSHHGPPRRNPLHPSSPFLLRPRLRVHLQSLWRSIASPTAPSRLVCLPSPPRAQIA